MPASIRAILPLALALAVTMPVCADSNDPVMMISAADQRAQAERVIRDLSREALADPVILGALRRASAENDGLTVADIAGRDEAWRRQAKRGRGPLLDAIMANPISRQLSLLRLPRASLIADVMLMDDRGLLVGATRLSSDYDQSDETKYQRTFLDGPEALIVEPPAYDESVDEYVMAVSITLTDPAGGHPLGVLTANMVLTALER